MPSHLCSKDLDKDKTENSKTKIIQDAKNEKDEKNPRKNSRDKFYQFSRYYSEIQELHLSSIINIFSPRH